MIAGTPIRWLTVLGLLLTFARIATGQMIRSDAIGNDPANERLCASRAKLTLGTSKTVPFEIDSGYVARTRALNADATFIVIDGMSPQLVECFLNQGTGRFEPNSFGPEQSYWHLIKPQQFQPPIGTRQSDSVAASVCRKGVSPKMTNPNFDHSVILSVVEINLGSPAYHPGTLIGEKRAERYDVVVTGKVFYRPASPDLTAINFTCLLSPMLELKTIQFK